MAGKEVAKKESTAVGQVIDYGEYGGQGMEDVSPDELVVPFINIIQGLSDELETVEGAKLGMFVNSVSSELIDGKTGFLFVPAKRDRCYVEWIPRKRGGGLVARHEIDAQIVLEAQNATEGGGKFGALYVNGGDAETENELRHTFYLVGVLLDEETWEPITQACLSFSSTKIKKYKAFMSTINMVKGNPPPPLFAHVVRVISVKEKNKHGEYYNFSLSPAAGNVAASMIGPEHPAFQAAAALYKGLLEGTAKMGEERDETAEKDIPF